MPLFTLGALWLSAAFWYCAPAAPPPTPVAHTRDQAPVSPAADTAYLMGKFDPAQHPDFTPVEAPYTDRPGMMMRREAFEDFKKMWAAAKKEGIMLKIISSTRTFAQQKAIWEGKWARFAREAPAPRDRALKILEYSSMPGASRHHWGTDIDLNDLNNNAFETGGKYAAVYTWLQAHAVEYGFGQPYTAKGPERPEGYNEERWHWSYLPLAKPLLTQYRSTLNDAAFGGFQGAETAALLHIVENYVGGVGKTCQP